MKTSIKIKVIDDAQTTCSVKLDKNKFPYIIIDNEKVVIGNLDFPKDISVNFGLSYYRLELLSGLEELKNILENPSLTVDHLSSKQLLKTF